MLLVAGCGNNQGGQGSSINGGKKVLRIGMATDVMSFDMANYVASNDLVPGYWVYDTLVKLNEDGGISPSLYNL